MPEHMPVHMSIHMPMHMPTHMSIHLSICMPTHMPTHMPIHMPMIDLAEGTELAGLELRDVTARKPKQDEQDSSVRQAVLVK